MNLSRSIAIHSKHSEVLESLLEKKKNQDGIFHVWLLLRARSDQDAIFTKSSKIQGSFCHCRHFDSVFHSWTNMAGALQPLSILTTKFVLISSYIYFIVTCNTGPKPISNGYTEWNLTGWNASICTPRCVYRSWEVISVDCMPTCSVDKKKENMLWTA